MNLELEEQVVVLTGATGGIGAEIAADFLKEESIVVCLIRSESKMEALKELLVSESIDIQNLHWYTCDLLNYDQIKKVIKQIVQDLKQINILVNCAGATHEYPFALLDEKRINQMVDLNLKSPIYLSQAVLRYMYKQKKGSIINISSISSVKKGRGIAVYAAAKSGLDSFTRTLALEVGRKNIRVNCIRPGVIETQMSKGLINRFADFTRDNTSLMRTGHPKEISKMVLFLASNNASYITGECINIDGGIN